MHFHYYEVMMQLLKRRDASHGALGKLERKLALLLDVCMCAVKHSRVPGLVHVCRARHMCVVTHTYVLWLFCMSV